MTKQDRESVWLTFIYSFVVGMIFFVTLGGCGLYSLSHPERLTPEQIEAYNKVGLDVYTCFQIAGPPPSGGTTVLTLPKGTKPNLSFSGNCQLIRAQLGSLP